MASPTRRASTRVTAGRRMAATAVRKMDTSRFAVLASQPGGPFEVYDRRTHQTVASGFSTAAKAKAEADARNADA